ncbi:MAG: mechanosensitive ion channel family protein [Ignavibacteriaceae bacterium]
MLENFFEIDKAAITRIIVTFIIILGLWVIHKVFIKVFLSKIEDATLKYKWKKFVIYFIFVLGVFIIIPLWFGAINSLSTYLGLVSAGIAISMKDLIVNFIGWIFIVSRKPFAVGDRIQIGDIKGDVIDLRVFQFSLLEIGGWVTGDQSTGRIIHMPNGIVFTQPQANYTMGFEYIWDEIPVLITFESDWVKAKSLLNEILNKNTLHLSPDVEKQLNETSKRYLIHYDKLTPIVYTSVKESGVELTLRFLCNPQQRRNTEELIWEEILIEFAKSDQLNLAYPTRRLYNNQAPQPLPPPDSLK